MSTARPYRQKPPKEKSPPALALLDESFHRLRAAPLAVLGIYYVGSLPFTLGLLYFWADLSHSADAERYGTGAALGLALLFLWMKLCHAVFADRLRALFNHRPARSWSVRWLLGLFIVQGTLHSVGLFVLVAASIVTVPLGWAYAFCQSVTAIGSGETGTVREVFRRSARAAVLWPKQNHLMLLTLSLLSLFVWINILSAVFGLPYLLKLVTGEENAFTRGGVDWSNSTFLMVTVCLAYLLLDPVVKTFYTLRCFYADSLHSGEDLKSELRGLPPVKPAAPVGRPAAAAGVAAALAAIFLLGMWPVGARAALAPAAPPATAALVPPPDTAPLPEGNIHPPQLDKTIEEVMHRREFAWRVPPVPTKADAEAARTGFFDNALQWFKDTVKWVFTQIGRAIQAVYDWCKALLKRWFPGDDKPSAPEVEHTGGGNIGGILRILVYALCTAIGVLLVYLGWRAWRQRNAPELAGQAISSGTPAAPDLSSDEVLATQLPEDEWLQLARRLLETGEHRLALRAFYLSILALLGARGLLVISRHKSNRDYLAELRRRARDQAGLQGAFHRSVGRYERVWYGPHPASQDLFDQFLADRQLIVEATAAPAVVPSAPVLA